MLQRIYCETFIKSSQCFDTLPLVALFKLSRFDFDWVMKWEHQFKQLSLGCYMFLLWLTLQHFEGWLGNLKVVLVDILLFFHCRFEQNVGKIRFHQRFFCHVCLQMHEIMLRKSEDFHLVFLFYLESRCLCLESFAKWLHRNIILISFLLLKRIKRDFWGMFSYLVTIMMKKKNEREKFNAFRSCSAK